jgi:hypothetical protein
MLVQCLGEKLAQGKNNKNFLLNLDETKINPTHHL